MAVLNIPISDLEARTRAVTAMRGRILADADIDVNRLQTQPKTMIGKRIDADQCEYHQ
jgi:hypothetical protein